VTTEQTTATTVEASAAAGQPSHHASPALPSEESTGVFMRNVGKQQTLAPTASDAGSTFTARPDGDCAEHTPQGTPGVAPPSAGAAANDRIAQHLQRELNAMRTRAEGAEWALRTLLQSVLRASTAQGAAINRPGPRQTSGPFRGRTGTVTTLSSQPSAQPTLSAAFGGNMSPGNPSLVAEGSASLNSRPSGIIHATSFVHGHVPGGPPAWMAGPTVVIPAVQPPPGNSPKATLRHVPPAVFDAVASSASGQSGQSGPSEQPSTTEPASAPSSVARRASNAEDLRSVMSMAVPPVRQTTEAKVTQDLPDGTMELNQLVVLSLLGAGTQGEVFFAFDTVANAARAVKAVRRPKRPHKSFRIARKAKAGTTNSVALARPTSAPVVPSPTGRCGDSARSRMTDGTSALADSRRCDSAPGLETAPVSALDGPNTALHASNEDALHDESPETSVANLVSPKDRLRELLEREIAIMKKCRHRNVVALYEVIDDPAVECMYLVMQYVEHGPLRTMQPGGLIIEPINPVRLAGYARQLCAGLEYLHRHGVIHRDIKPENILLGEDDQVFLADFGVADLFDGGDGADASGICGTRGTFPFLAPELFEDDHDDAPAPRENGAKPTGEQRLAAAAALAATTTATNSTITSDHGLAAQQAAAQRLVRGEAVDVWALGVTLYVLLYGSLPWRYTTTHELVEAIVRGPITFPDLPPPPGAAAAADDDDDAATQPPSSTKKDRRRSTAVFVTSHSPSESTEASPLPAAAAAVAASSAAGQASPEALPPPLAPPGDVSHGSDDGLNSASVSLGCGRSTMLPQPSLATAAAPSDVESGSEHTASPSRNRSRRQSLTQTDSTLGVSSGQWALESPGLTASVHISGAAEETDLRSPWKSLLRGMLERDPSRRLTISQARARAMRMLRTASKRAERLEQEAPTPAAITRIVRRPSMASLSLLHQQQQQQQQQLQTE